MSVILIHAQNAAAPGTFTPLQAAIAGSPAVRTSAPHELPVGSAGIWECTAGRFRRQVAQAEYSYFISGKGRFTPDGCPPIEFSAGDAIFFPANTQGEWEILESVRKAYLILA